MDVNVHTLKNDSAEVLLVRPGTNGTDALLLVPLQERTPTNLGKHNLIQ